MKEMARVPIVFGAICMLASIAFTILGEPHYPTPLAIGGAGFFIGGAMLASR